MKKKWAKISLILIAILVLGVGCSQKEDGTTVDGDEKTTADKGEETTVKTESKTNTEEKDERDEEMESKSGNAAAPEQEEPVKFQVYFSNEDATELVKETVETDELTPENVLKALAEKGALPENIKINSLEESEKDGEKVLDVDVSQEFAAYMSNKGSTGEYMALGSLCNTFLDAYGCDKIRITVEGNVFTTGHNEYPGYLGFHE